MQSCHELDLWHIIHIQGFITPNFLPVCLMVMAALAIVHACFWVGLGLGKCLISSQIRHVLRLNFGVNLLSYGGTLKT